MLNSFTTDASTLRFVIATTAFRMGLTDPYKRSYSLGYAFMRSMFKRLLVVRWTTVTSNVGKPTKKVFQTACF